MSPARNQPVTSQLPAANQFGVRFSTAPETSAAHLTAMLEQGWTKYCPAAVRSRLPRPQGQVMLFWWTTATREN